MKVKTRIIIPVGVLVALLVGVGLILTILWSRRRKVFVPDGTPAEAILPSKPPPTPLSIIRIPSAPCLATTAAFTSLRKCSKQSDCASCTESPTSCVLVGGESGVAADGSLTYPVGVNVALPPSADTCSGHGSLSAGSCVCDGNWDENGVCTDDVCYRGDTCEVGVFNVTHAGQYCLPSYLGKCDEFTSDTVLTNTGAGTTWSCACKQSMAGIFTQEVEGGNCNTQIACGAPVGVTAQVNVGTLATPVFEESVVYPDRLTSYTQGEEACVYMTSMGRRANQPGVGFTPIPPNAPDTALFVEGALPDADPTCVPRLYSNKCTIATGGGNTQVIRGSNMPGDPLLERVSPPFYTPVPPGLNHCPDGWTGRGTFAAPCTNPENANEKYAFFTADGEWIGPTITSAQELRTWWVEKGPASPWATLSNGDVACIERGMVGSSFATSTHATSDFCVDDDCTMAEGARAVAWKGARDGPLVDEELKPHWVTGGPYGGQCTCDGSYAGGHPRVSQMDATPDTWWSCGPDMCRGTNFPNAKWNKESGMCDCNLEESTEMQAPFTTGMHYKHPATSAVCVRDPCNPSGVNVGVNEVSCVTDAWCGGLCSENQCYIPFADQKTCSKDIDCTGVVSGMSNRVTKCVDGTCATLDLARDRMGSTCTKDSHCSLGACTGPLGGPKTCTGGCGCAAGHHQVSDGGISPLGFTCADDCVGKCLNGGICVHLPEGGTECRCTPYFGGDRCETKLCSRFMEYCDGENPCCSGCPCTEPSSHCCNRFPKEPTPADRQIACENNTCQYIKPTLRKHCEGYAFYTSAVQNFPRNAINGSDPIFPLPKIDPTFVCSKMDEVCSSSTPCCNESGGPGHDWTEKVTKCEAGKCVDAGGNLAMFGNSRTTCSVKIPHADAISHFHTEFPPDCNGWGIRDERGTCVCDPSRKGSNCETSKCALEQESCGIDADCCNSCRCPNGQHNAGCCADTRSPYSPFTHCTGGFCQRVDA